MRVTKMWQAGGQRRRYGDLSRVSAALSFKYLHCARITNEPGLILSPELVYQTEQNEGRPGNGRADWWSGAEGRACQVEIK